jgi:hypothetical protein
MQSVLGALLTAGFAAAMASAIAAAPNASQITDSAQAQLQQSFASADAIAAAEPQYSAQIIAAARSSFVDGANSAYIAGIIAVLLGAALVWWAFPKKAGELAMLAEFAAEDAPTAGDVAPPAGTVTEPGRLADS